MLWLASGGQKAQITLYIKVSLTHVYTYICAYIYIPAKSLPWFVFRVSRNNQEIIFKSGLKNKLFWDKECKGSGRSMREALAAWLRHVVYTYAHIHTHIYYHICTCLQTYI